MPRVSVTDDGGPSRGSLGKSDLSFQVDVVFGLETDPFHG
jgi:hypothetical protein